MKSSSRVERDSVDPLIDELLLDGSLSQAERNRIQTFLNGAHCRSRPTEERRVSDVAKALQYVKRTRAGGIPAQPLSILSVCAEERGHNPFSPPDPAIREKVLRRRAAHSRRRESDGFVVRMHDDAGKSFPEVGKLLGLAAGHVHRQYVRELALRQLERRISEQGASSAGKAEPGI